MALAIDGSVHGNNASTTSIGVNLTTTQTNDYIIVVIETNGGPVVSVSSVALGSFTFMASQLVPAQTTQYEEVWYKFSSGTLTADTITVTNSIANFITVDAFGVSGSGQLSAIFDSGGPQTSATDPISITTASPSTMVIAGFRVGTTSPTNGAGFTQIAGANFALVEYKLLSSAQTLSCTVGTGVGTSNGSIAFGIVAAGSSVILGANQKLLVM